MELCPFLLAETLSQKYEKIILGKMWVERLFLRMTLTFGVIKYASQLLLICWILHYRDEKVWGLWWNYLLFSIMAQVLNPSQIHVFQILPSDLISYLFLQFTNSQHCSLFPSKKNSLNFGDNFGLHLQKHFI